MIARKFLTLAAVLAAAGTAQAQEVAPNDMLLATLWNQSASILRNQDRDERERAMLPIFEQISQVVNDFSVELDNAYLLIEDAARLGQIELVFRGLVPGELEQEFEIGADDTVIGRSRGQPLEVEFRYDGSAGPRLLVRGRAHVFHRGPRPLQASRPILSFEILNTDTGENNIGLTCPFPGSGFEFSGGCHCVVTDLTIPAPSPFP